ncbi:MAG: 2-C-methyl-D-erythritol 4-phosphate cytidylyltransferase, partial [Clostridiaceae bacterium]|nr:2-C-methyl-D-erythritol 4-phosphate cytidylyltransferase [Clostridiaceae bacterium]
FKYDLILDCHKKNHKDGIKVTDDTMVVERYGNKVYLFEGSCNNIKITTPEDLEIGRQILERF